MRQILRLAGQKRKLKQRCVHAPAGEQILTNEVPRSVVRNGSLAFVSRRVRNRASRYSSRQSGDGAKICGRDTWRLFYRAPLLQAGFQILGLRAPSWSIVERIAARHAQ